MPHHKECTRKMLGQARAAQRHRVVIADTARAATMDDGPPRAPRLRWCCTSIHFPRGLLCGPVPRARPRAEAAGTSSMRRAASAGRGSAKRAPCSCRCGRITALGSNVKPRTLFHKRHQPASAGTQAIRRACLSVIHGRGRWEMREFG